MLEGYEMEEDYKMSKEEFINDLEITEGFYEKGYFDIRTCYQIKSRIADAYRKSLEEEK